jgi:hypothetical protein
MTRLAKSVRREASAGLKNGGAPIFEQIGRLFVEMGLKSNPNRE